MVMLGLDSIRETTFLCSAVRTALRPRPIALYGGPRPRVTRVTCITITGAYELPILSIHCGISPGMYVFWPFAATVS